MRNKVKVELWLCSNKTGKKELNKEEGTFQNDEIRRKNKSRELATIVATRTCRYRPMSLVLSCTFTVQYRRRKEQAGKMDALQQSIVVSLIVCPFSVFFSFSLFSRCLGNRLPREGERKEKEEKDGGGDSGRKGFPFLSFSLYFRKEGGKGRIIWEMERDKVQSEAISPNTEIKKFFFHFPFGFSRTS